MPLQTCPLLIIHPAAWKMCSQKFETFRTLFIHADTLADSSSRPPGYVAAQVQSFLSCDSGPFSLGTLQTCSCH
jgi:hypothetical protein